MASTSTLYPSSTMQPALHGETEAASTSTLYPSPTMQQALHEEKEAASATTIYSPSTLHPALHKEKGAASKCYKCRQLGHYQKNCPLNKDTYTKHKKIQKVTKKHHPLHLEDQTLLVTKAYRPLHLQERRPQNTKAYRPPHLRGGRPPDPMATSGGAHKSTSPSDVSLYSGTGSIKNDYQETNIKDNSDYSLPPPTSSTVELQELTENVNTPSIIHGSNDHDYGGKSKQSMLVDPDVNA